MKVWLDGRLVESEAAKVSVFDHGLTVGDGVFETTKVVDGVPFALTRHLARLARSATALGLSLPQEAELREAVSALLAANIGEEVGRLRITVTGGVGPLGSDRGGTGPTVVVACSPAKSWPASSTLVTVPWPRNERSAVSGAKTTSYAENVVALAYAHERGASEALFLNTRGEVCEGTGSNLFLVLDGQLLTPPLDGAARALCVRSRGASTCPWSSAATARTTRRNPARACAPANGWTAPRSRIGSDRRH